MLLLHYMFIFVVMVIFAYFCGSIPFGKIISHRHGIDIQRRGSGNIGFANVLRIVGWRAALPVLVLDVFKGFVPTIVATVYFDVSAGFAVGFFAIFGHLFSLWLKGKGGKGIATGLGVLLGTTPLVGIIGFSVYIVTSFILRRSSDASITAGVAVALAGCLLFPRYIWAYLVLICIAVWALRKNLFGTVPNYDA